MRRRGISPQTVKGGPCIPASFGGGHAHIKLSETALRLGIDYSLQP
ncbi:MAG TPA: hypothetical protein VMH92_07465 [Acidocella sp.]|nr:hypothetical protein [Acidocella sp.]